MTQLSNIEKKSDEKVDFDLPDVSDEGGKMAPRIHNAGEDSTCVACEG